MSEAEEFTPAVLLVDDEANILSSLRRLLRRQRYDIFTAESGREGLEILEREHIDLVVSDMRMPEMSGAEFLEEVSRKWPDTVRIILTGYADLEATVSAVNKAGIFRYLSKPWDEHDLISTIEQGLETLRLRRERDRLVEELRTLNESLEAQVRARTEEIRQTAEMLDLAYKELSNSYTSIIRVFSSLVSLNKKKYKGQSRAVADLAKYMGLALKLPKDEVRQIYFAGLLHEMGKMVLPDRLLEKPEQMLQGDDLAQYQQYPVHGENALTSVEELNRTARYIRHHCEYFNGSGFPDGLKGEDIPLGARILRLARDYVGLQTGLMLSQSLDHEGAVEYIGHHSKTLYDPQLVALFLKIRDKIKLDIAPAEEMMCRTHALKAGMVLTRDLMSDAGVLLVAKGQALNENIIDKIMRIEKSEKAQYKVYVEVHEGAEA
ncbi:HD domain-containing phosphohydrolase [Hahella sp. SMD15-11]|uniref:HD domain-containing phosphohydrolase n=1 Tax=Thermohahella caldifontis TaxID=3142973 RepID=A0AB39UXQ8_9GAMM